MKIISLLISVYSIIKTKALECVSVANQKCMPRPKILDVNEGIVEALFYPYKVLVNKCSGSCNTLDNPMSKICVPKIIKNVNMQVYNFLMRLNETRNVLWHESCKCVCKLSSSVCNNKQIWNDDTCRCDCNEDFAGKISCAKGYMWNPSTCECQCDSTLWVDPKRIVNLLDFELNSISNTPDASSKDLIEVYEVRYDDGGFYLVVDDIKGYFNTDDKVSSILNLILTDDKKNKDHQVWKKFLKKINDGNGELILHEKIRLIDSNFPIEKIFKIHSITIAIKSLIEKDNKFYLELALNRCLFEPYEIKL